MVLAVFYAVFRHFWPLHDTIVAFHVQYTVFSWKNAFSLYWNLSRLWKKSGDNFHKYKKKYSFLKLTPKIWLSQKRDKAESRICWPHWCWSTWLYTSKYRNFKAIEKTEKKNHALGTWVHHLRKIRQSRCHTLTQLSHIHGYFLFSVLCANIICYSRKDLNRGINCLIWD